MLGIMAIAFFGACASESGGGPSVAGVPQPTPTPVPTCPAGQALDVNNVCRPSVLSGGNQVPLVLVSTAELARMFFNSNPNNPQDVKIRVNVNAGRDAVVVSYVDGGVLHQAGFGTVHPTSGISDSTYNRWYTDAQTNKQVWKGFFQDSFGAVVLVIDKFLSQGDGQPGNIVGGSIWFQNFNRYYPNNPVQGPDKMCWQITAGPYDCRSFLFGWDWNNMIITPSLSTYPNNKGPDANMLYEKLGDFYGLDRAAIGI